MKIGIFFKTGASFLLCLLFLGIGQAQARQAGWVPAPQPADKALTKSAKSPEKSRKSSSKPAPKPENGDTVYSGQPPVTDADVRQFVILLPQFRAWARQNHEDAHPILAANGKPDFLYSPKAAQWLNEHKFNPARFFCVMGKMAAALVIVEEGNDLQGMRPQDMPAVTPSELDLARRHMGELLKAGGPPQPINK